MIKLCSFVLIASLFITSSAFGQEINRTQLQQVTKVEPARASYLLPPQGQQTAAAPATAPAPAPKPASTGTSHKKRNIIIAVVVGAVVAGVVIAATNGGSSGSGY
jgi:hypothetical protein